MKSGNLTLLYGILALLAVVLFVCYLLLEKKGERQFLLLFGCVAAVNMGYFLLTVCQSLAFARLANALSYFGAAYSVTAMMLIIWKVCRMPRLRWLTALLFAISTAAFLLAASGDLFGLYYKRIWLESVNGMTCLRKEYGPAHIVYTVYLMSYVLGMLGTISYAAAKKQLASLKYVVFLIAIVLLNIGVWAVEQAVDTDFELLSVSYIVGEVLLLVVYSMLRDYGIISPETGLLSVQMLTRQPNGQLPAGIEDMFCGFAEKATTLSSAERRILAYYIAGHEIQDIPELAYISIHTVKKHNRSIYQKLEVASRDELMLYIELFRSCGRLHELTGEMPETK